MANINRFGSVIRQISPKATWTVTFVSNGGSSVESQTINDKEYAIVPTPPTKSGYILLGWYTDDETFEQQFDFINTQITSNITLYAQWEELQDIRGEATYSSAGTYSWVCPEGVISVSVSGISGGGGGGKSTSNISTFRASSGSAGGSGAIGYKNNITVIPGQSYTVVVGSGGLGATSSGGSGTSGGETYFINTSTFRLSGGGGGINSTSVGGAAGTVLVADGGTNGLVGQTTTSSSSVPPGHGSVTLYGISTTGGGSGAGAFANTTAGNGVRGLVRIVWGAGRAFPSTDIGPT